MTPQEIDKRLFGLCQPEGVVWNGRHYAHDDIGGMWWKPSEVWSDLEPLVEKACKDNPGLFFQSDNAVSSNTWCGEFVMKCNATLSRATAPTLCEAASLALIALLEEKR